MSGRKHVDIGLRHSLPHELVFEVPIGVSHSVISLNVGVEALVIEDAVNSPIESLDSRIFLVKL